MNRCLYLRQDRRPKPKRFVDSCVVGWRAGSFAHPSNSVCGNKTKETTKKVGVEQYGPRTLRSRRAAFPQSEAIQENPGTPEDRKGPCSEVLHDSRRAPLLLFAEFLKSVMERKYSLARKLCQMILIYEPENPEAKQFIPLIEAKLLMEPEEDIGLHTSDSDTENEGESLEPSNCTCSDDLEEEVEATS
ncbi:glutamate-rich protein 2 isoform X3 [Paramormyrops kingsleyae]|nr:glutamate-rich protein 2 isoform X3 [Paramormyrops kingsleyae]